MKLVEKCGYPIALLTDIIKKLASGEKLEAKYNDHQLKGSYIGCRECHIMSDWLLVYEIEEKTLFLYLMRTGTHSDLF